MDYVSTDSVPYFKDCAAVVDGEGYRLIELHAVPRQDGAHVTAVIASRDASRDIGVADCAKVHRALEPRLASLLGGGVFMEVCSPGVERNFKNAAEFAFFVGRAVRVWDKDAGGWVPGTIISADSSRVTLETEGGAQSFAYENIAKAKFIHV